MILMAIGCTTEKEVSPRLWKILAPWSWYIRTGDKNILESISHNDTRVRCHLHLTSAHNIPTPTETMYICVSPHIKQAYNFTVDSMRLKPFSSARTQPVNIFFVLTRSLSCLFSAHMRSFLHPLQSQQTSSLYQKSMSQHAPTIGFDAVSS
jgi:hypothetical protein